MVALPTGSIQFPLLQNPASILGFLTGRDVTLFTYDLPKLRLGFTYKYSYPVFPGLNAFLAGNVSATTVS